MKFVYFNEEWNNDICPNHGTKFNEDGICPICLEEKNNRHGSNNRKLQGVSNSGKGTHRKNRTTGTRKT